MTNNYLDEGDYTSEYNQFLSNDLWPFVAKLLKKTDHFSKGRSYFFAGNGASASIASHIANDVTKALCCKARTFHDPAHITCFANDYGYEQWLAESIKIFADEGDVVILISSSGRSPNILRAAEAAVAKKAVLVTLTGPSPNVNLLEYSACHLSVASKIYNIIECCHMIALTTAVDCVNTVRLD